MTDHGGDMFELEGGATGGEGCGGGEGGDGALGLLVGGGAVVGVIAVAFVIVGRSGGFRGGTCERACSE